MNHSKCRRKRSIEAELAGAEISPHAKLINSSSILNPRKLFHQTIGATAFAESVNQFAAKGSSSVKNC